MKKVSSKVKKIKPVKAKKLSAIRRNPDIFWKGAGLGFFAGFAVGAAIVAVIDYYDEKHSEIRRIEKASDENYYYTTD